MRLLRPRTCALLLAGLVSASCLSACGPQSENADFDAAIGRGRPAEVTVHGRVTEVLPDRTGPRGTHERFRVDVDGITTVEVDHNLSLAERAPVTPGKWVRIHGQMEPDRGHPVIHYTHHSTGHHEGGFIEVDGRRYD